MSKFWDQHKKVLLPMGGAVVVLGYMVITGQLSQDGGLVIFSTSSTRGPKSYDSYPEHVLKDNKDYQARVRVTDYGEFTIDLFEEYTPIAVNNFVFLAQDQFYNRVSIHKVAKDLLFQTGEPGTDNNDLGYAFKDEFNENVVFNKYVVAYANSGRDTNGSEFFVVCPNITDAELKELAGNFTIFGIVTSGQDVVDKICTNNYSEIDEDYHPIIISAVTIRTVTTEEDQINDGN